jgi:uncharacterized protein YjbI with pentapeptide repeats
VVVDKDAVGRIRQRVHRGFIAAAHTGLDDRRDAEAAVSDKSKPTEDRNSQRDFVRPPTIEAKNSRWGIRGKTVWDWLQLLIVPLALAVIGFLFTVQQDARQQQIEDQRAQQAQKIENQRAEAERALQQQNAQDEALQAYLDQMNMLLLEKDLRSSDESSEVRTLARARTLTVLGRLDDPSHKAAVMQFLEEAKLIQRVEGTGPIIRLGADLSGAELIEANLSGANVEDADVDGALLLKADLSGTDFSGASLDKANLYDADLSQANLSQARLLQADLSHANLSGADLSWAFLLDAEGVTEELLKQKASALGWATMPDGQQYVTAEFEPALSFRVPRHEWRPSSSDTSDKRNLFLEVLEGPEGSQLIFTNPSGVFDLSTPSEPRLRPVPENADEWASWFQRHPNLETSNSVPVRVGSATGVQIDVTEVSARDTYPQECGDKPCVLLYPTSSESGMIIWEGGKHRFVIVDVGSETVVIDVAAPEDKFDEFLPQAQKVLDTVQWRGG